MKCDHLLGRKFDGEVYILASDVMEAVAELKSNLDKAIAERDGNKVCIDALKQKLENVQASMYCDVVDANMDNRRLRRALWIARAKRAFDCKEIFRLELRINELKQTYVGSGYYMVMINKWQNVERKCLKKAEEYK